MFIIAFIAVINLVTFLTFALDKRAAQKGKWCIKEATLFSLAVLGGGLGAMLGMKTFHHKTKKFWFKIGIPLITVVNICVFAYIIIKI